MGRWTDISRQLSERQGQAFQVAGKAQRRDQKCVRVQDPGNLALPGNDGSSGVCCVNGG